MLIDHFFDDSQADTGAGVGTTAAVQSLKRAEDALFVLLIETNSVISYFSMTQYVPERAVANEAGTFLPLTCSAWI